MTGSTCQEAVKQPEWALKAEKQHCFMLPKGPYLVGKNGPGARGIHHDQMGQKSTSLKPLLGLCREVVEFVQNLFPLLGETMVDTELKITVLRHILERALKFLCSRNEVPG